MAATTKALPAGLRLISLRLVSCAIEAKVLVPNAQLSAENQRVGMTYIPFAGGQGVVYRLRYSVEGRDLIVDKPICTFACTYEITYSAETALTEAHIRLLVPEAFQCLHDYLREFLQTGSRLLGLPPFTLDVSVPPKTVEWTPEVTH